MSVGLFLGSASGSLDLTSSDGGAATYSMAVLADGFDPGSAEAVKTVVASLMRDGDISRIDRYSNRTVTFRVEVSAADSTGLGDGERALSLALSSVASLTLYMPDGYAETVWDVYNGTMSAEVDDLAWLRTPITQVYAVTLECHPWARAIDKTTVTFAPGSGTVTTVDAGSSTAYWAAASGGGLSAATWLGEAAIKYVSPGVILWQGTLGSDPFVAFDLATDQSGTSGSYIYAPWSTTLNGQAPLSVESRSSGWTRFWFAKPSAAAQLSVSVLGYGGATPELYVGGLYSTTVLPTAGAMSVPVGGSVRTECTLTASRTSGTINNPMIYSDPQMAGGFHPAQEVSWPLGVAGDYQFWLPTATTAASAGDIVTIDITAGGKTQQLRTRYELSTGWFEVGVATFRQNQSGLIGAFTYVVKVNGTPVTVTPRVFRDDEDTSLIYIPGNLTSPVVLASPSAEHPFGGLWAGGVDIHDMVAAKDDILLVPPLTTIYFDVGSFTNVTLTAEFYARGHTFGVK